MEFRMFRVFLSSRMWVPCACDSQRKALTSSLFLAILVPWHGQTLSWPCSKPVCVTSACWGQWGHEHGSKAQNKLWFGCVYLPSICHKHTAPSVCVLTVLLSHTACKPEFTKPIPMLHVILSCREDGRANTRLCLHCVMLFWAEDALLSRRAGDQAGQAGILQVNGMWSFCPPLWHCLLFSKYVMTAEQWTREVGLLLKYTGGITEPMLTSLLAL